jgi:hypothetical protein
MLKEQLVKVFSLMKVLSLLSLWDLGKSMAYREH